MSHWQEVALEDICDIQIGRTPTRKETKYWGGEHPWLSISDMNQGRTLVSTKERITDAAVIERKCKLVTAGTVLLSFKLSIGKVGITQIPMYTNEAIAALPIRDEKVIEADYLARTLESLDLTKGQDRAAMGSTLNLPKLRKIKIPLPPLDEQRRIATILDKADELRTRRQEAIAKLDTLAQSIFIDMFGDPATNPLGWNTASLGDLANSINNGLFRKNPEYCTTGETGLPVVWVEELFRGDQLDLSRSRQLKASAQEVSKYGLQYGDILFCRSSLKLDGIAFNNVYLGESNRALFESHVIRVSPDINQVNPIFLNSLFRNPNMRAVVKSKSKTATMTTIDQKAISSVDIVLPEYGQQRRFADSIQAIETQKQTQNQQLSNHERLFLSLQQSAFKGEL